jgi:hypothetical protein
MMFTRPDWRNYLAKTPKLDQPSFSTFRLSRKDKDWQLSENVKVILNPRSAGKKVLGTAVITSRERINHYSEVTDEMVLQDGFESKAIFEGWWKRTHGKRAEESFFRLVLTWVSREQMIQ